jgi:hypothetical protein
MPSGLSPICLAVTLLLLPLVAAKCGSCESAGPGTSADQPAWLDGLKKERTESLAKVGYKGGVFATPELAWTQTNYMQPQMHSYDRFFYDPVKHEYTVDKFLDDLKTRYGGVDSILMWPTYTNIGVDDRNQFDLFRTMPGGLDAVRNITLQLQHRGVRVLWPYNPWDLGTHREPLSDEDTFAKLLKQTNGDGFNGDTMNVVPESFYKSALALDYPIAFEPEGGGSDDALNWATMGWGYWSYDTAPGVDRQKFLTSGKFMTNICNRWAQNKQNDVQNAWFNGCGYETWENGTCSVPLCCCCSHCPLSAHHLIFLPLFSLGHLEWHSRARCRGYPPRWYHVPFFRWQGRFEIIPKSQA